MSRLCIKIVEKNSITRKNLNSSPPRFFPGFLYLSLSLSQATWKGMKHLFSHDVGARSKVDGHWHKKQFLFCVFSIPTHHHPSEWDSYALSLQYFKPFIHSKIREWFSLLQLEKDSFHLIKL